MSSYTDIPTGAVELLLTACLLIGCALAVLYTGRSRQGYLLPLMVAFGIRVAAAIVHRFVVVLPQGGSDAVVFERRAWEWAQSGCGNLGEHLNLEGLVCAVPDERQYLCMCWARVIAKKEARDERDRPDKNLKSFRTCVRLD